MIRRALIRLNPWASRFVRRGGAAMARPEARLAFRAARRAHTLALLREGRAAVIDWASEMAELEPKSPRGLRLWRRLARLDASMTVFEGHLDLRAAPFPGAVDFSGARFVGDLHLDAAAVRGPALFRGANFNGQVSFTSFRIERGLDLEEAYFGGRVEATQLVCGAEARFDRAFWSADAWFRDAWFAGGARFEHARFMSDAAFLRSRFDARALFDNARFNGGASFEHARFADEASFSDARFAGGVHTSGVQFARPLDGAALSASVARSIGRFRPRLVVDHGAAAPRRDHTA